MARARTANLRVAHERTCAVRKPRTDGAVPEPSALSTLDACTCRPSFFTFHRDDDARIVKGPRTTRIEAEKQLRKILVAIDEGKVGVVNRTTLDEWLDEWLATVGTKKSTRSTCETTANYVRDILPGVDFRNLTGSHMRKFVTVLRAEDKNHKRLAEDTVAKHVRQFRACLNAAVQEGLLDKVPPLHKSFRPKPKPENPAYYTDDELPLIWRGLREHEDEKLARFTLAFNQAAYTTGMRLGELTAFRWPNLDLVRRELHVAETWSPKGGLSSPKGNEHRTIDLNDAALAVFTEWVAYLADPDTTTGDGLVFPNPGYRGTHGDYIPSWAATRDWLYPALKRAGVPRVGERGVERDFHSWRHTFARVGLENGAPITWVSSQLGHSSIDLTIGKYGRWQRASEKAMAQSEQISAAFSV